MQEPWEAELELALNNAIDPWRLTDVLDRLTIMLERHCRSDKAKGLTQQPWEMALEKVLGESTPEQVLVILRKIKGWTCGFCISCGTYNNTCGGKRGCECEYKGEWDG